MTLFSRSFLILAAVLSASLAQAATVRLDFTATVSSTNGSDTALVGRYIFDTTQPSHIDANNTAQYRMSVIEGQVTIGGVAYQAVTEAEASRVFFGDDISGQGDLFGMWAPVRVDPTNSGLLALQMFDTSESIFNSTAFAEFDFSLDAFDAFTDLNGTAIYVADIQGIITDGYAFDTLTYTVVPLPAGVWLFLSALSVLGVARRR